jgi:hypothetical protein
MVHGSVHSVSPPLGAWLARFHVSQSQPLDLTQGWGFLTSGQAPRVENPGLNVAHLLFTHQGTQTDGAMAKTGFHLVATVLLLIGVLSAAQVRDNQIPHLKIFLLEV